MDPTDQVYPSGVASWAAVMIWGICLAMWGTGLWILTDAGPTFEGFVAAALCLLVGAAPLGFVYRTHYIITRGELVIQSGPLRKRIRLDQIVDVTSKLTPGVNFAMSRENVLQVNVRDSKLGYRISPADRIVLRAISGTFPLPSRLETRRKSLDVVEGKSLCRRERNRARTS